MSYYVDLLFNQLFYIIYLSASITGFYYLLLTIKLLKIILQILQQYVE